VELPLSILADMEVMDVEKEKLILLFLFFLEVLEEEDDDNKENEFEFSLLFSSLSFDEENKEPVLGCIFVRLQ
jgi:hypothetical protein